MLAGFPNEQLCQTQSAAAFMKFSPWASRAGVFINLESIGPGGSPIIFQHAGAWTIEAFAKGAVHPRGAIAAQVGCQHTCVRCTAVPLHLLNPLIATMLPQPGSVQACTLHKHATNTPLPCHAMCCFMCRTCLMPVWCWGTQTTGSSLTKSGDSCQVHTVYHRLHDNIAVTMVTLLLSVQ